jgi:hypothetical protein
MTISLRPIPDSISAKGRARLINTLLCDGADCTNPPTRSVPGFFGVGKFCERCAFYFAYNVVNARESVNPTPEGQALLKGICWE